MTATPQSKAALAKYQRDSILSASPAQLITMLYGRLVLDIRRAEAAQAEQDWARASSELVHAQAIITELSSSLRPEIWAGGEQLLGIYTYATRLLIEANIERNAERTHEALVLLEPLKAAWDEAAVSLSGLQGAASSVA